MKLKQTTTGIVYEYSKFLAARPDMVPFEDDVVEGVVLSEKTEPEKKPKRRALEVGEVVPAPEEF